MRRILWAALALVILLPACTTTTRSNGEPAKPADQADYPIDTADSEPAQQGKPYRFEVATHCGIDWAVDFDESFWKPTREDARAYRRGDLDLRQPSDRGTMTLVSDEEAVYRSKRGPVIHYTRGEATRPDTPCY